MIRRITTALLAGMAGVVAAFGAADAQEHVHSPGDAIESRPAGDAPDTAEAQAHDAAHRMWMATLPGGWTLMGMAHAFPSATFAGPFSSESPLRRNRLALPHAAAMANIESPEARIVLRLMPNFEGATMADGETTFGGWGEGFIDARHPHTLLHEAMLSINGWGAPGGALSISAGRGFAPYGTGDPMYRPALKYPTNHHLSQILERWTVNASYLADVGLGVEIGIFDGNEPDDWLDVGNIDNFGNSWSGRLSWRFGAIEGITAPWEVSTSYGRVRESHGATEELTELYNAALRHDARYGFGTLYGLVEASRSEPEDGDGYFSILGEAQAGLGANDRHRPYARMEYATRPEYPRLGDSGDDFFRYDHDDHAIGSTRWLIGTVGYGYDLTALPLGTRPFVEVQHSRVRAESGPQALDPQNLYGGSSFWSISAGVRVFLGGGPMRMGSYGVLDAMTTSMRTMHDDSAMPADDAHGDHHEGR